MTKKTLFSALALSAIMGATLALPATATAHEAAVRKTVTVIKATEHRGTAHRDRVERQQPVSSRWASPRHGNRHMEHHSRGKGHKYGHRKHRYQHHERHHPRGYRDHHPVRQRYPAQRDHRNDSRVRIHIGYDLVL